MTPEQIYWQGWKDYCAEAEKLLARMLQGLERATPLKLPDAASNTTEEK
jgi:hypothetical protein